MRHIQTVPTIERRNGHRRKPPNPNSRTYSWILTRAERRHNGRVDNKMDEIYTKDALWEAARDSEMQRTPTPADEETCKDAHDPRTMRETTTKKHFFRARPDGITPHNKKKYGTSWNSRARQTSKKKKGKWL